MSVSPKVGRCMSREKERELFLVNTKFRNPRRDRLKGDVFRF